VAEEESKGSFCGSQEEMTKEQLEHFANTSVMAFESLAHFTTYLNAIKVNLLMAVLSVQVPGCETSKVKGSVVVLGNPGLDPEDLKDLIETLGKDADFSVRQAQTVVALAIEKSIAEEKPSCDNCPSRDTCENCSDKKETVH